MGSPFIWAGNFAKSLKGLLNLNDTAYVLQGTVDPTSSAQNAPQGSIYLRTGASGGALYTKQDAGSTTNWTRNGGGMAPGAWQSNLTFTINNFGTISSQVSEYRIEGDSIRARITASNGTATGSAASITLPSGYVIDTTKMPTNTSGTLVGTYAASGGATGSLYAGNAAGALWYDGSDTAKIYLANQYTTTGLVKAAGNSAGFNNGQLTLEFLLPIVGLANNVIASPDIRYFSSSTTISGSLATIVYATKDYDAGTAYASGIYTVPTAGKYQVNAALLITGTIALNNNLIMEIQKNSTVVSRFTEFFPATLTDGKGMLSDIISCAAGDTLRIQASSTATLPSIVSSNFDNYLSIAWIGT